MQMSYVIPGVPRLLRLAGFGLFAALGVATQYLVNGANGTLLGLAVFVPGMLLVWAKNFRNKPMDLGFEDWQPATAAEFERILNNLSASKKTKYSALQRRGPGLTLVVVCVMVSFFLGGRTNGGVLPLALLDLGVLLVPFAFGGNVYLWTPLELAHRMASLQTVIAEEGEGGSVVVTPYLRLDKDKEGRQIPEDVRLMIEPRRKPEDFLGVQLQVALNKGPNGTVPYLYAVFLCRGKGATYNKVTALDFDDLVTEPGGDDEYGYVVVRQPTGGGGYHTTPAQCRRLYTLVRRKLMEIAA